MSSTNDIKKKFDSLKEKGQDLGAKVGTEQDGGSGGRFQEYENGRIYWHQNTGAHEVHGEILKRYLEEGGPGANPETGRRHFGYPISDESRTEDGLFPVSRFEFGDILFVRGMKGGTVIHGDFYQAWKNQGSEIGGLAYPLSEPLSVAGGKAVFFERGCLWKGPATGEEMITCRIEPPLIGKPDLVHLSGGEIRNFLTARWVGLDQGLLDTIEQNRPGLLTEIWDDRLLVKRVAKDEVNKDQIALQMQETSLTKFTNSVTVNVHFRLSNTGPVRPRDRTLYDLAVRLPKSESRTMAPHAFYMAMNWEKFGFIHVTDIHVAKRIERFQKKILDLASQDPEFREAAIHFNNFNDNFRDFIRYANHLHDRGLLDIILATGDLVDYGFDPDERKNHQGGNYGFFEQIIRGQTHAVSGKQNEELRVPIFTVFGNHDYRVNPYKLLFDVTHASSLSDELHRKEFGPYNLTETEVEELQGDVPTVSSEAAKKMVAIDTNDQQDLYRYYKKRINKDSAYVLNLGAHRIVMLDTRFDAFIPTSGATDDLAFLGKKLLGNLSENQRRSSNGSPNLVGFNQADIDMVRKTLSEADLAGLVIIGMHAPPLNIEGTEFGHFFRETEHPTIDRKEVDAFLSRHDASGDSSDWPRNGTAHFKTGSTENMLDDGVARGEMDDFLRVCAGVDVPRPVDMVLCGHNHDRVEYRLKWDESSQHFQFFTDFYLGNPTHYYPSKKAEVDGLVHLEIKDGAEINAKPQRITDNTVNPPMQFHQLDVPPYKNPLNSVAESKKFKSAWWAARRPLIVETTALGPIDRKQRRKGSKKPSASFQGFRYFGVKQNEIFESHYVVLRELRSSGFELPWENQTGSGKKPTAPPVGPVQPLSPANPGPGTGTIKNG